MYPDRFTLPFITSVLCAAAERQRPALGAWTPQTRARLGEIFASELAEIRTRFFELFDDAAYWSHIEKQALEVAFPRYAALAEKETALEQRDFGLWRGGDLIARGTYGLIGFAIGIIMVKWSVIPIPETWDLFAFACGLGAPFIPDLQVSWQRRRYKRALRQVCKDMAEAQQQLELYPQLGVAPVDPGADSSSEDTSEKVPAPSKREGA